jgi:hypothetical protein
MAMKRPISRYVLARNDNVVRVDFSREPEPPEPGFPGAPGLRTPSYEPLGFAGRPPATAIQRPAS